MIYRLLIYDKVVEEFSNSHDVMGIVGNGAAYSIQKSAGMKKLIY